MFLCMFCKCCLLLSGMGCTAVALYIAFRDVNNHVFISSASKIQAPGPEIAEVLLLNLFSNREVIKKIATRPPGGGKGTKPVDAPLFKPTETSYDISWWFGPLKKLKMDFSKAGCGGGVYRIEVEQQYFRVDLSRKLVVSAILTLRPRTLIKKHKKLWIWLLQHEWICLFSRKSHIMAVFFSLFFFLSFGIVVFWGNKGSFYVIAKSS